MANNLVVQLLLKTGSFSSDLKTAKGQVQNFQQGCQTAGKSLDAFGKSIGIDIGALTKFGSVIGVAAAAGAGLKKVIDSNQVSSDKFQEAIYASKTAVDSLATAIGTFDFSNFQDGLSGLISRAREAAQEIDQLGNTLMSYNVVSAKANAAVAAYRAGEKKFKNGQITDEELQVLKSNAEAAVAELNESTNLAMDDLASTIIAEANAKGAKLSGEGAMALIDEMLTLDGKRIRDDVKASMKVMQDEYNKELATLQGQYPAGIVSGSSITGGMMYGTGVDTKNPEYQKRLSELNQQYMRLHTYNTLLVKESDESLKHMGEQRAQIYNLEASLSNLEGRLETTNDKANNTTSNVTNGLKQEMEAQQGSLEYWKKMMQEAQKHRDMEVFNSTAWKTYDQALQNAIEHIKMLESLLKRYQNQQPGEKGNAVGIPDNAPVGKMESGVTMGLNGKVTPVALDANQMRSHISFLEKERDTMKEGNPQIETHTKLIDSLTERYRKITGKGVDLPSPDKKDTDKWQAFNSAMADTANIIGAFTSSFQDGMKITAASILKMVSTALPALSTLIGTLATLAGVEATEKAVSTAKHWIEAIAAVAAVGAAVATALSAAKSGGKFANGGIVGGSSFTGDRITANVNSGEMILNKTQQARLFKLANGGAVGGSQVEFHISGTELVGVLNNMNRKNRLIQ